MRIRTFLAGGMLGLAATGPVARGQTTPRVVNVSGVAYDSLNGGPLGNAFIRISGSSRTTTTNMRGRFFFDSVVPGTYTFTMLHEALDSTGLSGVTTRVTIKDGSEIVELSVPSFATLWRLECGPSKPPTDSGMVFGTVRDAASRKAVAGATISVRWFELGFDLSRGVTQHRWSGEVRSDSTGGYTLCGVPTDVAFRLLATRDSAATGLLDIQPSDQRVRRRDLVLGSSSNAVGTIAGLVRGRAGPVSGARVVVSGAPEIRSGDDGRFLVTNVPVGTRQVEVLTTATAPAVAIVDVTPNDTAVVEFRLQQITPLAPVSIKAPSLRQRILSDIDARRTQGLGTVMDSTTIMHYASPLNAITMTVNPENVCALYIDGVKEGRTMADAWKEFRFRAAGDIAVMELHKGVDIPVEYKGRCTGPRHVVVLVWTKNRLR